MNPSATHKMYICGYSFGWNGAKEKITIYKKGELWYFNHYFVNGDVYHKLVQYYNPNKKQFELKGIEDFNKVVEYLKYNNFEIFLSNGLRDITEKYADGDKIIRIKYINLGIAINHLAHCEWKFVLHNVDGNELFSTKNWVDKVTRGSIMRKTARIMMFKKEDKYTLVIKGKGQDGRCRWCSSFFTTLRKRGEEEKIFIVEDWICPFDKPYHPKSRYKKKIEDLLRTYR